MADLPVLDIAPFINEPTSSAGVRFVDELRTVCHEIGFAHIIGHRVDPDLERRLLAVTRQFFALPEDARRSLAIENSAAFRGYTVLGDERTADGRDWRDQLDIGPEQEAPETGHPGPAWLRLRGPNQWPAELPHMAPTALSWLDEMNELGHAVMRALAVGLGQPIGFFDAFFDPADLHAKLIRYPAGERPTDQGVGRHHDSGLLTFILQDDVAGLEVELSGEMVSVEPLRGAYVMNLGAMMQAATNGYLRATPHRVVAPAGTEDRLSIAFFFNPAFETVFEPIDLPPELSARAEPDLVDLKGEAIHTLYGENNLKVRLRTHPDVARRHYPDVLNSHTPSSP
ncbi:MAG: isopenicillin N synthase family dioxygenase [Acidimicrobiales bacterium]